MPITDQGLHSDGLKAALRAATAGNAAELERMLCRLGAATAKPNLRLAAAFGAEIAAFTGPVAPLLQRLAGDDAAPDTDRVFLPIAAAHGWAGCVRAERDVDVAWESLAALAADERAPVRIGTCDALTALGTREGGADVLVTRAFDWLNNEDREERMGTAALVVETLADRLVLAGVREPRALLDYLSRIVNEIAEAPRSAERSDAHRRLLRALPRLLAAVVSHAGDAPNAQHWFEGVCTDAQHPHVRGVLSDVIVQLATSSRGPGAAVVARLRASLQASAKPLRDPTRLRPGTGRGKASRRTR